MRNVCAPDARVDPRFPVGGAPTVLRVGELGANIRIFQKLHKIEKICGRRGEIRHCDVRVYLHRASAEAANTKSMEASTQASSDTFEVCRLPLGVR